MNTEALAELAETRTLVRSGAARPIRLNAGLSLGEVAKSIGVSPATILRWETGERVPHGEAAVAYGRLLYALTRPRRRPGSRVAA